MAYSQRILISRADAIGDVILTLPLATLLRQKYPDAVIGFLGKAYTKPVIACCSAVDEFIDAGDFLQHTDDRKAATWDAIIHVFPRKDIAREALQARIPLRVGTSSRLYHWLTCNKLVRLSRRHSGLHEAQLNTKLLAPFGIREHLTTGELGKLYAFDKIPPLPVEFAGLLHPGKYHIILHPKSQGSAREWGLEHFITLIRLLPRDVYQIFVSGTPAEAELLKPLFAAVGDMVTDITGLFDLTTFIAFIAAADALVAASTGPLHIAATLGKCAIGIYPPIRPMHAGRWGPLGEKAIALSLTKECSDCRDKPQACACIRSIAPVEVADLLRQKLPEVM